MNNSFLYYLPSLMFLLRLSGVSLPPYRHDICITHYLSQHAPSSPIVALVSGYSLHTNAPSLTNFAPIQINDRVDRCSLNTCIAFTHTMLVDSMTVIAKVITIADTDWLLMIMIQKAQIRLRFISASIQIEGLF